MTTPTDPAATGQMRFVDDYAPGLLAGDYVAEATWALGVDGAAPQTQRQPFTVAAPQFSLPPGEIRAMYPPAGSSGAFDRVLPHVVLTERLLPWERGLSGVPAGTPWLALLALAPEELVVSASDGPPTTVATGFAETTTVGALLASGGEGLRVPQLAQEFAGSTEPCQTITIAADTFAAVMPTALELPFLAHGRDVDIAAKPAVDMTHEGEFAVVVANRFPPTAAGVSAPCIVHLVSIEGYTDLLGGDTPIAPTAPLVKLVSLAQWTFSCEPDASQTFSGLAAQLAVRADGTARPPSELLLRLPGTAGDAPLPTDAAAAVTTRLADGYVAAGYHARTGEDGWAWYRGPFVPTVQPPSTLPPFTTADAAIIFDPASGVFDHRLAAAWQCGRSLALANQAFAETLLRMRHTARGAILPLTATADDLPEAPDALAILLRGGLLRAVADATTATPPVPAVWARGATAATGSVTRRVRAAVGTPDAETAIDEAVDATGDLAAVGRWLGRLLLLEGVPFDHLVPDARMLPPESLRCFYLDGAWTAAAVDGALSIGIGSEEDAQLQAVLGVRQRAAGQAAAWSARADACGLPLPLDGGGPLAGFLLRSALVTGWPGLTVHASAAGAALDPLRLEVLSPGVMLCVLSGVPDTIAFTAPHEGLAFGVDDDGEIVLRGPDGRSDAESPRVTIYQPDQPAPAGDVALRPGGQRVLNLVSRALPPAPPAVPTDLVTSIAGPLAIAPPALGSAGFALQMVLGPEQYTFSSPTTETEYAPR